MERGRYAADLSDAEYVCLVPCPPPPEPIGRPRLCPRRENLDGIGSVACTGCQWRPLPHEFWPWQTVYHYFPLWRLDGTWERIPALRAGTIIASSDHAA